MSCQPKEQIRPIEANQITDDPELLWIYTSHVNSCLWPMQNSGVSSRLEPFAEAVFRARNRILIMDPHFAGIHGLATLWDVFEQTEAEVIQILTNRQSEMQQWLDEEGLILPGKVEVRNNRIVNVHDRFSIVDNDLWHFGSTVGGGYLGLSAASHGWNKHTAAFSSLFENYWRGRYAR